MLERTVYRFYNWAEQSIVDERKNPIPGDQIETVEYTFDGKNKTGRFIKSNDNSDTLYFPGMGDDVFRNFGNQIIYPKTGKTKKTNELIFNLLLNNPHITKLFAFSNGCNNLISALEYIIAIAKSNDNPERAQQATEILRRIKILNVSSPYVTIGNSYKDSPFLNRIGRWFVSLVEDKEARTGFHSQVPLSMRMSKVVAKLKEIQKNDPENPPIGILSNATKDDVCENYETYRRKEESYCNEKKLNLKDELQNITLVEDDSHGNQEIHDPITLEKDNSKLIIDMIKAIDNQTIPLKMKKLKDRYKGILYDFNHISSYQNKINNLINYQDKNYNYKIVPNFNYINNFIRNTKERIEKLEQDDPINDHLNTKIQQLETKNEELSDKLISYNFHHISLCQEEVNNCINDEEKYDNFKIVNLFNFIYKLINDAERRIKTSKQDDTINDHLKEKIEQFREKNEELTEKFKKFKQDKMEKIIEMEKKQPEISHDNSERNSHLSVKDNEMKEEVLKNLVSMEEVGSNACCVQ